MEKINESLTVIFIHPGPFLTPSSIMHHNQSFGCMTFPFAHLLLCSLIYKELSIMSG